MTVEQIFLKVLNMGISAGWLILTVIVLRLLLRRAPKWVPCFLWGIVAIRLICPFSIESAWSLVPNGNTVDTGRVYLGTIAIDSGVSIVNRVVNRVALQLLGPVGVGSEDRNAVVDTGQAVEIGSETGSEAGLGTGLETGDAAAGGIMITEMGQAAEHLNPSVARGYMVRVYPPLNSVARQKLVAATTNPEPNEDLPGGLYLLVDVEPALIFIGILSRIWLIGIAGMFAYAVISFLVLRRKVAEAVPMEGNGDIFGQARVLLCDAIDSPFILGLFRPRIYLPSSIGERNAVFVIAHEQAHLRRRDNWWKAVGFVLLAVYWFHPLVWLAYALLGKDIELACDESVVSGFDMADRKAYASTLLSCSMHRKMVFTYPLAFGEVGVKERVKAVLNSKKPAFWIVAGAVVICAAVAVCFLTNPKQDRSIDGGGNEDSSENVGENNGEGITDGIAEGAEIPDGPALPGADNIYPKIMVNENVYEWRRGRAVEDTLPEGCVYYGELVHVDGETPENDCAFVSEFAATGKIYTMPENSAVVYIRIKTDWMEDKVVLFDLISGQGEENLLQRPVINLADNVGADSIELLYADKERIIFSGYFGLFAYSKELRCIIRSVDLKAIGCNYTQGDNYCEKWVSADGDTVYLHPMSMEQMYVYHVMEDTLERKPFDLEQVSLHKVPVLPGDNADEDPIGSNYDLWADGEQMMCTVLNWYVGMIGELSYADFAYGKDGEIVPPYYPLFVPFASDGLSGAADFRPEEIHDLKAVDVWMNGQMRHMSDPEALKMVEDMLASAKAEKGASDCPFDVAMYLTREDGTVGVIFPAMDGDTKYLSGKTCYQYPASWGMKLWDYFDDGLKLSLIDGTLTMPERGVAEWFSRLDLPEGYAFSEYQNNIGWMGGFLILPQAYDVAGAMEKLGEGRGGTDGLPPVEWQYSGMVSMIPAQNTDITYTDGLPNLSGIPLQNHSEIEYIKVIGLERSNLQWPAIMVRESHDLYTAPQLVELAEKGVNTGKMELTSEYWTFYFVKESESKGNYFILSLSTKEFTQEEAEKAAYSVVIQQ